MFFCYVKIGTQALVRPGSPNSSISEDRMNLQHPICLAKALVDSQTNSYDKEALRFKVSERSVERQHNKEKFQRKHFSISFKIRRKVILSK